MAGIAHHHYEGSFRWWQDQLLLRRAIIFCASAGVLGFLALDGAGYDLVIRQQVGLVAWGIVAVGFAIGLLPRARPARVLILPLLCAIALLAWMLLSLQWTDSTERTSAEIARFLTYAGLITLAACGLNRHTFRSAAAGLSVAAIFVAGFAVTSRLFPELLPEASELNQAFQTDRLSYPLDYWNAVGIWGAMAVAIGLAWSAHARLTVIRALALAAVPVAGLAVYLSYSRSGVIGTIVAALAVLALSRNRWTVFAHLLAAAGGTALAIAVVRGQDEIARATGGAGGETVLLALASAALICLVAVLATDWIDLDRARIPRATVRWVLPVFICGALIGGFALAQEPVTRAWDQFAHEDAPASGPDPAARLTSAGGSRIQLYESALDAFEAHPIKGIGPGTYEYWWAQNGDSPEFVRDAHSLYLEQLAELGLPGLLLLLAALGGLLAAALRARGQSTDPSDIGAIAALTAGFLVFAVTAGADWMWEETAVSVLALAGLAVAAAAGSERLRRGQRRGPLPRLGVRAAIVLVAVAAAAAELPGVVATERTRASEQAVRDGDLTEARELADSAVDAQPWAASPRLQLGIVQGRQGDLREASQTVSDAAEKEPTNWRIPLVAAAIQQQMGNESLAERTFDDGRRLSPSSPFYAGSR